MMNFGFGNQLGGMGMFGNMGMPGSMGMPMMPQQAGGVNNKMMQMMMMLMMQLMQMMMQGGGGFGGQGGAGCSSCGAGGALSPAQGAYNQGQGLGFNPSSGGSGSGGSSASAPASSGASSSSGGGGSSSGGIGASANPTPSVNPSSVKDLDSTNGLNASSINGLNIAHQFGLPLISGKRGGNPRSDHFHGNAIDVGTLPIGAASSTEGTQAMKDYAEYMRQQGKAGKHKVKYIILDGKIASARNNWQWRDYTYPGKSQSELDNLKKNNRGEYNRIQHYDHVHISFHQ